MLPVFFLEAINDRLSSWDNVTFLSLNKKVTKELSIGGGFLQRRPLLCTTPPKPDWPEYFYNEAGMYRFPPIRTLKHRTSGRKSEHFLPDQDLS